MKIFSPSMIVALFGAILLFPGAVNASPWGARHVPLVPEPESPWDSSMSFGFNLTQGNSDTLLISLGAKSTYERDRNIWDFNLSANEGETENETTQREVTAEVAYKRRFSERWYFGLGVLALRDEIADIDYRTNLNPAIGHFLLKNKKTSLSLELGPTFVAEKVGEQEEQYIAGRVANNFSYKLSETGKIFQSTAVTVSTENASRYVIRADAGVESKLNSFLALVLTITDEYNNQPADDKVKNDLSVISSLQVSF